MYEVVLSRDAARTLEKGYASDETTHHRRPGKGQGQSPQRKEAPGRSGGIVQPAHWGMRAVYEVDDEKKAVVVHAIGSRGDIYKK